MDYLGADNRPSASPPGALLGSDEAERFARELLPHVPHDAVFLFDARMRIRFCGGDLMRRLGFQPEHVAGRLVEEVLPAPMWERLQPLYARVLAGEAYITDYEATTGRAYRMHGTPVIDAGGGIEGGLLVAREVVTPAEQRLTERLRQHSAVAQLGKLAVTGGVDLTSLIEEACRLVADTLPADGVGVVELLPSRRGSSCATSPAGA